jgi:hypothetical protein
MCDFYTAILSVLHHDGIAYLCKNHFIPPNAFDHNGRIISQPFALPIYLCRYVTPPTLGMSGSVQLVSSHHIKNFYQILGTMLQ